MQGIDNYQPGGDGFLINPSIGIERGLTRNPCIFITIKSVKMEPAKSAAWNTVSEIELIYRSKVKPSERPRLIESKAVHQFLISHWDLNRIELVEDTKAILMNKSHRVLGLFDLSRGGVSGTVVDPRILFIAALKLNANTIILAHNHPSGNLQPSEQDKLMTQKVKQAGLLLDIQLIDHVIVTSEGYYSFADEGLL